MSSDECFLQGFVPDWVQLQKDIRERKVQIRKELAELRQRLGPEPLSEANIQRWSDNCDRIEKAEIFPLNKKIEQFNLIVPNMYNQMFPYNFQKEAENIFKTAFDPNVRIAKDERENEKSSEETKKFSPETPPDTDKVSSWWSFFKR